MKHTLTILLILLLCGCTAADESPVLTPSPTPTPQSTSDSSIVQNDENEEVIYYMESVEDFMEEYIPMMNTMVRLKVVAGDAEALYDKAYAVMSKYHKLLDSHHYYQDEDGTLVKNIAIINDSYGSGVPVEVSEEMIEILQEALHMSKLSEGYFNPMMGNLIDLWTPKFSAFPIENTDPEEADIEKARACVPSIAQMEEVLVIDAENNTVTFNKMEGCSETVSINLGAFSKGYIIDKCREALKDDESVWLLDAGTSTVAGYDPENLKTWTAGVISPYNKAAMLYALTLSTDDCLSTSGDGNNYFLLNQGEQTIVRCHVLNPFTGYSENTYRSVSVLVKDNAAVSDVLSTVMFSIKDKNTAFKIIQSFEDAYNTEIDVSWIRETDSEFQLASVEATDKLYHSILDETVMDAVEHIILLEEAK